MDRWKRYSQPETDRSYLKLINIYKEVLHPNLQHILIWCRLLASSYPIMGRLFNHITNNPSTITQEALTDYVIKMINKIHCTGDDNVAVAIETQSTENVPDADDPISEISVTLDNNTGNIGYSFIAFDEPNV